MRPSTKGMKDIEFFILDKVTVIKEDRSVLNGTITGFQGRANETTLVADSAGYITAVKSSCLHPLIAAITPRVDSMNEQQLREEIRRCYRWAEVLKKKASDAPIVWMNGAQKFGYKEGDKFIKTYHLPDYMWVENGKYWADPSEDPYDIADCILDGEKYKDEV